MVGGVEDVGPAVKRARFSGGGRGGGSGGLAEESGAAAAAAAAGDIADVADLLLAPLCYAGVAVAVQAAAGDCGAPTALPRPAPPRALFPRCRGSGRFVPLPNPCDWVIPPLPLRGPAREDASGAAGGEDLGVAADEIEDFDDPKEGPQQEEVAEFSEGTRVLGTSGEPLASAISYAPVGSGGGCGNSESAGCMDMLRHCWRARHLAPTWPEAFFDRAAAANAARAHGSSEPMAGATLTLARTAEEAAATGFWGGACGIDGTGDAAGNVGGDPFVVAADAKRRTQQTVVFAGNCPQAEWDLLQGSRHEEQTGQEEDAQEKQWEESCGVNARNRARLGAGDDARDCAQVLLACVPDFQKQPSVILVDLADVAAVRRVDF
eukprot:TRINITY_DN71912_c0_g1_i1.p1 TRINITY_DN71912_c0_g1~~TRINITY_DN71912_c0_g1_i1.p1  ORF type:complete len:442 (-),score=103.10 TRINITY_DN71912_c0_g1_i1:136-1269(-)